MPRTTRGSVTTSAPRIASRAAKCYPPAMDLTYTPEELAFQREVRAWLKRNVPKRQRDDRPIEFGDPRRIAEPRPGSGRSTRPAIWRSPGRAVRRPGRDIMRQTIVNEEMVRARAPGLIGLLGISMVGQRSSSTAARSSAAATCRRS